MPRYYMIWPASRDGVLAYSKSAWHQERSWLVLDITEGLGGARVVEGPVTRTIALRRERELRSVDQSKTLKEDAP